MPSPYRRTRGLYHPRSQEAYPLSRFRLENFIRCQRCFYLDRRLGIEPPPIPSFTLNSAVDELLKKEFDLYRARQEAHPLMKKFGVDAVPFQHPKMNEWREVFKGVRYHHPATNFTVFGAVDDLWINKQKELIVADYKATSTAGAVTLEGEYKDGYKRQMEIYQWLLRKNGFPVSSIGYFVYCNGDKSRPVFDNKLDFFVDLIPYSGDDSWIERILKEAHQCLRSSQLPEAAQNCLNCRYHATLTEAEHEMIAGKEDAAMVHKPIQGELF